MHFIPMIFLVLDMLVNKIKIPGKAITLQFMIWIIFIVYTVIFEAVTSLPANFEHLNYFCLGSVSNLYINSYKIYKSLPVASSCHKLEKDGNKLWSRFDDAKLGCQLLSNRIYCHGENDSATTNGGRKNEWSFFNNAALYLLSDISSGVTGLTHYVDGGLKVVGIPNQDLVNI